MSYNNLSPNHFWKRMIFILNCIYKWIVDETGLNGAIWSVSIYIVDSTCLGSIVLLLLYYATQF